MTFECGCKNNELIISLRSEVDFYKNEYEKLRQKIDEVTQFDAAPCNDDTYQSFIQINTDFQTYKKTSTDAINNLKEQIQYIDTERLTYYNLWKISQQTICNLEAEIDQYWKQSNNPDSFQQLANKIRASEQKNIELRHEIDSGKTIEMSLAKSKTICEAQMNALDKKYNDLTIEHKEVLAQLKNMENVLRENRFEMVEIRKERDEYKIQIKSLSELHKQYQVRETVAYTKIQDALHMVEIALAEKNAALQREKEIRDECDQLALTIGRVMEEAGEKVEVNIDEIKSTYAQRLQKFEDIIKKLIVSKEALAKNNHLSKKQVHEMQTSVTNIMTLNKKLDAELQTATKTIVELEMKLKAYEKLIACEQATSKECEDRSNQLRTLLDNNIKLKQKWRDSYHEMTESMKRELIHLQSENSLLITENQKLHKELCKRNKS